ncbi:DVU_1555 family C-GCAxxG-C-C protein [Paludibacterium sp.]|uniref:DVU_1555 family C-GCAxxG-C-C protein n=1 Tax=Paludibacterium sp. TaxID=1917523 RepID=UPI0025D2F2B5|nr:DV_1555 family C-GCAxxG-C-C protein [Paludibacterium sp.]MBV8646097.1 C_GCAxxG_C_C family protein [Paludibacterium sp.]
MNDEGFCVAEWSLQGFTCSHIMVMMGLRAMGHDNPELLRAMSGLSLGMGNGLTCGVLTGGCCLLGLYAGKGGSDEEADPRLARMLEEYTEWFSDECRGKYPGTDCADIMQGRPDLKVERCPGLTLAGVQKAFEILDAYRFSPDNAERAKKD